MAPSLGGFLFRGTLGIPGIQGTEVETSYEKLKGWNCAVSAQTEERPAPHRAETL